jgi:hypothetical protein
MLGLMNPVANSSQPADGVRFALNEVRQDRAALLVIGGLCVAITLVYFHFVALQYPDRRFDIHQLIVQGEALSPYRYRVLLPWLVHGIASGVSHLRIFPYRTTVGALYVVFTGVGFAVGFLVFYLYMRRWFPPQTALLGTVYLCALAPFTFMYIYFQPWAWWDLAVFTGGIWMAHEERRLSLLWLVIAASFLRETAVFLALLYFLGRRGADSPRSLLLWTGLYGASSAAVFVGLRFALGWARHVGQAEFSSPLFYRLVYNFTHIMPALTLVIFFGVFWILALKHLHAKPRILTNLLWFVPVFLVVHLFSAHMNESRYYFEIAPIIMPLALMSLFPCGTVVRRPD